MEVIKAIVSSSEPLAKLVLYAIKKKGVMSILRLADISWKHV